MPRHFRPPPTTDGAEGSHRHPSPGTTKATKSALPLPPPSQYSSNACTIAAVVTGGSVKWSARSRKDNTINIATCSRWNWSVVHGASWKRRAVE